MPSKGKKNSKAQSKLSNSDSFASSGSLDFEANEVGFANSLEHASSKYPSLIGKSAFIGQATDVDDSSKGCKIWLSEPSMVANSFTPGSIVSVSLPSLKNRFSDSFPLSSLADESRRFGVESCKHLANEPGNYFALATIFPSSKVSKNGVRLSSNLSNTMGCPASGRLMFIHSVQNKVRAGLLSDTEKPHSTKDCLLVSDCKELILELLHSNSRLTMNSTSTTISAEKSFYRSENGMLASPKTPLNQSNLSFSNSSPLASPRHEESASSVITLDESFVEPLILQLRRLRALNLSESKVKEVPKEIGELLHLRYIDLSWNWDLKELPDAMCNLCNLETLHLEWCRSLEKLPKAMGKLINLKHLYVDDCWKLSGLPKGVGRLRGVRILDRFVCGGDDDKEILELGELGSFEHLQGTTLEITKLGNVKDGREQAQKAQLEKKKHLLKLTLDFDGYSGGSEEQQQISDAEVLNELRPHQHLKILGVYNYQGTSVPPNWIMSLQHLTHLTLQLFEYCECLPPLGKLPYLEVLFIAGMKRVEKVGVELLGIEETQTSPATATAFPKLKQLQFREMYSWEEWEGVGDDCQVTICPVFPVYTFGVHPS